HGAQARQSSCHGPARASGDPAPSGPRALRIRQPVPDYGRSRSLLKFGSTSAVRSLVARGELSPSGAGPRRTLMFRTDELDRFVEFRGRRRVLSRQRHAAPGEKGVSDANERRSNQISGRPKVDDKTYRVRFKLKDPRTGKRGR